MKKKSEAFLCLVAIIRRQFGYSQERLALELGVTRQTIYLIEAQKIRPSLELALKIGSIFETPVEELFVFTTEADARIRKWELVNGSSWLRSGSDRPNL